MIINSKSNNVDKRSNVVHYLLENKKIKNKTMAAKKKAKKVAKKKAAKKKKA